MGFESKRWPAAEKVPISELSFILLNQKETQKDKEDIKCSICGSNKHIPSMCLNNNSKVFQEKEEVKEKKAPEIYKLIVNLSPTLVKLSNLPAATQRNELHALLREKGIMYDTVKMVHDKINPTEFKGVVYIDLPTKEAADKLVSIFNGMKMDIQIVSAQIVEDKYK